MEAFDFAVGLGPIGACASVFDIAERIAKGMRSVARPIIGQNFSDCDAALVEPGVGADPECSGGLFAFIGEQFAVDQARVCVDGGVQKVIAQGIAVFSHHSATFVGLTIDPSRRAAHHPPSTARGDLAHFLDVHMDQFADGGRFDVAHGPASRAVQPAQPGHPVTGQHSVHRKRMNAQQIADLGWSPTAQLAIHSEVFFMSPRHAVPNVRGQYN